MKRVNPLLSAGAALLALCLLLTVGAYQLGAMQRTNTPQTQPEVMAANTAAAEQTASAQEANSNGPAPTLTLVGDAEVNTDTGTPYVDPGCTAQDAQGNDLTASVTTEGSVPKDTPGDYTIRYRVTDSNGATATLQRVVHVAAAPEVPTDKVIYLTFDDGPSCYTQQLLDVLEKYNVKATFFTTHAFPEYEDLIGKEYEAGHSVAIHSYTHDYDKIYASTDAYWEDLQAQQDVIVAQTGQETKLVRFPGGSSNTVSDFTPGIMTALAQQLHDKGYEYFDWNVSSGDAGETTSTDQVVENVISGIQNCSVSVVLQHDSKDYSVAAVERIIQWGQENGYTFLPLRLDSPNAHHNINN